jgi:Ca2+-dependent lipid-binding protein
LHLQGWTGQDKTLFLSPDEAKARSVLADFFSDQYYGSWYHNSGIIIFAVLASHFVTLFGGGWAWLIIIL